MRDKELKLSKQAFEYALKNINTKSIREIARELNIDHSYLRKKLKKEAAYCEPRSGRPRKEVDVERIILLYKSGIGCQKIGRMFGLSASSISTRVRQEIGTLRTIRQVWVMRKAGESDESIEDFLARTGGAARHKNTVKRLEELQKTM
mgnify:CR=1 FL=1